MNLKQVPCFRHLSWRPSYKELREFGLTMLCGFLVLGLISFARSRAVTPAVVMLCVAGIVLAVFSMIPGLNRIVYLAVNVPTSAFGYLVSRVALGLAFFLVFLPIGRFLRWTGKDLLQFKGGSSTWVAVEDKTDASNYSHQF